MKPADKFVHAEHKTCRPERKPSRKTENERPPPVTLWHGKKHERPDGIELHLEAKRPEMGKCPRPFARSHNEKISRKRKMPRPERTGSVEIQQAPHCHRSPQHR